MMKDIGIEHRIKIKIGRATYNIAMAVDIEGAVGEGSIDESLENQLKALRYNIRKVLFPEMTDKELHE